jgi:hypothetical protein
LIRVLGIWAERANWGWILGGNLIDKLLAS